MYTWVEHTAELELSIQADSEKEVLADALQALAELLDPDRRPRPTETREVAVSAGDGAALLAAWLEELVFLAESEGFVGRELSSCALRGERLETRVAGHLGRPRPVVKAVTYHRLCFEREGDGFAARVVLDV